MDMTKQLRSTMKSQPLQAGIIRHCIAGTLFRAVRHFRFIPARASAVLIES